jgi:hypothetical protein
MAWHAECFAVLVACGFTVLLNNNYVIGSGQSITNKENYIQLRKYLQIVAAGASQQAKRLNMA